ncbi:MAG: hypothetical protein ABIG69_11835 [Bacteroidota bacterium]
MAEEKEEDIKAGIIPVLLSDLNPGCQQDWLNKSLTAAQREDFVFGKEDFIVGFYNDEQKVKRHDMDESI